MKDNMSDQDSTPFSVGYVLRTTAKHMRKSIDMSIRKTFDRMPEFHGNQEKSTEVLQALDALHKMRGMLDDFQLHNKHIFNKE